MPFIILWSTTGCAVRYFDSTTGIEHIWGIGHLRTRVTPAQDGVRAVIVGSRTVGLGVGAGPDDYSAAFGWSDWQKVTVADDSAVDLEWPRGNRFGMSVGAPIDSHYLKTIHQTQRPVPIKQERTP